MEREFEARRFNLQNLNPDVLDFVKSNALRIDGGEVTDGDIRLMSGIIESAKKIGPVVCNFEENRGLDGFVLAVSKKKANKEDPSYPVMFSYLGDTKSPTEYTIENNLKILAIKQNPEFTSSAKVDGGALLFKNNWIISVSGFAKPSMNTVVTLGIAFGTKLIQYDDAIKRAREEGMECLDLFVKYADRLTGPFLPRLNSRDDIYEEPHSNI